VLYTHQKMKKSKTWQDGILRIRTGGSKAILFDDKGQCLESFFIKSQVNAGDNLESERYLITVEAVKVNEKPFEDQPRKAEAPAADRNGVKPSVLPPRHLSVGLKRKFTGFQGPRQVEKKISTVEDGVKPTILPLSKECQGTFPSKFYITSPLFSMVCKKDAETNLSADFHEDACTDNGRERMPLSSLLSASFLDRCEETEKQNSDQFIVKPEPPLITRQAKSSSQTAGHGAASHNIRSTAQIIALLKSKPTQGCGEQTSEVTECLSRFQVSENAESLCNKKSPILPAFSGNPAERLIQNIQHLPFTEGTVNDKERNAEMLLNSAEQPCGKEVPEQRHDKKANNLSQDLEDPCNTNSCFLPENLSRYREHSVTNVLKESSSVRLQSELQPRQNSVRAPSDLELSVGETLTEIEIVKEELNCLKGEDVAQSSALRLHSYCEAVTPSKNEEVKCSIDTGRIAEDSANETRIEVELLGDGHNAKEINESQLSVRKNPDGCAALTINDVSLIKSKHSDLLPGDINVNECHAKTGMFEKHEILPVISTSRIISAMDKRSEDDVKQLGCMKSPDADFEHFWGTKSDGMKPDNPLLALSSIYPLGKGRSSPEETAIGETEFENVESINAFPGACKGERVGMDCLKCTIMAENSSDLPDLVNNIALLRALTQHSTALESLQKMEENTSIFHE
ncbi:ZGRF1 protein, partial [Sula dactylatra]|nr:ZGRF1 protein [Sula dactylatra]